MITDFKDGVAVVLKGDGYTNDVVYIDAAMKEIYPKLTQKNVGYSASNDLKPTGILSENMRAYFDCKLQRWGYMDHHGNPVVEPQFLEALPLPRRPGGRAGRNRKMGSPALGIHRRAGEDGDRTHL